MGAKGSNPVLLVRERANGADQHSTFGTGLAPATPGRPATGYASCGLKGLSRHAERFAIEKRRDLGLRRLGSAWSPSAWRAFRAVRKISVKGAPRALSPAAAPQALRQRAARPGFDPPAVEHGYEDKHP
jgi:hypothetical protein